MTRFEPNKRSAGVARLFLVAAAALLLLPPAAARAAIVVESGTSFALTARAGHVSTADGGSIYAWGYTSGPMMQMPGPTLEVTAGDTVMVTLTNALPAAAGNVSIVFPGHVITSTTGGVPGLLTQEAPPGGSVTYTFTASQPGTYVYQSGTRPDLQVEMGLFGAIIVRPTAGQVTAAACPSGLPAYDHPETCYDQEYLFLLSEIDIEAHNAAEMQAGGPGPIDYVAEPYRSEYWLLNGRTAPDTFLPDFIGDLPTQPYGCLPRMHPGERLLIRLVGVGRQMHPFHHHGNHSRVLARDGRLLLSATDSSKLAGPLLFTIPSVPGQTVDAIFEWTGKDLGWDIYGHEAGGGIACTDAVNNKTLLPPGDGYDDLDGGDNDWEWCADHERPIPVTLPDLSVLAFGGFWSGSPYLGLLGSLPPGEGGLNPDAGFTYMWHSHTERELTNNDIFPGGIMTMLIVEAPWVPID